MRNDWAEELQIGALATAAGVNVQMIRYHERIGLLAEPRRTSGGFRVYDGEAVQRLRFIRRARELGFSLETVRDLAPPDACGVSRSRGASTPCYWDELTPRAKCCGSS